MTNGDKPHSQFLSHLTSYPLVSDGISTYKSNPYGAKSLSFVNSAYSTAYTNLFQPVSPYLSGPYSYVSPYLAKADSLGDNGLSTLESRFPIVKAETATIQEKVQGIAYMPWNVASQGKDYVFQTYDDEYKKTQGTGIVKQAKAVIGTEIKLTAAFFQLVADFLGKAKQEGKEIIEKKTSNST